MIAFDAMVWARELHRDQVRKYTGTPYADHLAEVAGIVATVTEGWPWGEETWVTREEKIAVAWLHDCVEDQAVDPNAIRQRFGFAVALGVAALSDTEQGNRAERKAASRQRLSAAPSWVQTIKCADLISNTSSIVLHDPKFAKVYLAEKLALLDVMTDADPRLRLMAIDQAQTAMRRLA